eukprot:4144669-Pleurochrysis_carterae.AAC.4
MPTVNSNCSSAHRQPCAASDQQKRYCHFRATAWAGAHVFGGDAGVVEGVQGHLRRRFSDGLRGERAHHLARLDAVLQESVLHLSEQPVEGLRREAVLEQHALRRERRAQQREEVVRRVLLRLARERVVALDDFEPLDQAAHLHASKHHTHRRSLLPVIKSRSGDRWSCAHREEG